ncbi:MAG: TPM domain-containing protein, partial [Proteobacteria bacterium]|nr:TPM domain-containing protein [Pseudomonadota bacterium]
MKRALLVLSLLLLAATAGHALEVPPQGGQWVVDAARLLPAGEKDALAESLRAYAAKSGNQVVVLTVPGLGGEDLSAYANRVAREWEVGQKDKNNGVLILVAQAEKMVRIEVGRGIEDRLPDLRAKRIQTEVTLPLFRAGRFGPGLMATAQAIQTALEAGQAPDGDA